MSQYVKRWIQKVFDSIWKLVFNGTGAKLVAGALAVNNWH
jgi:hypothetical protein